MRRDCGGRARYAHRRERDRGGLRDLEAPETLPLGLIRRSGGGRNPWPRRMPAYRLSDDHAPALLLARPYLRQK